MNNCVIQKSSLRCSSCLRKNIHCDGVFSDAEFDLLEAKKTDLNRKRMETRSRLTNLAWELQEKMVALEAQALDELDGLTPSRSDIVVGDPVTLMSDVVFSWDDSEILAMIQGRGGSPEQIQV
jgi:hypothetical protein